MTSPTAYMRYSGPIKLVHGKNAAIAGCESRRREVELHDVALSPRGDKQSFDRQGLPDFIRTPIPSLSRLQASISSFQ
jgi:hypothetical protein